MKQYLARAIHQTIRFHVLGEAPGGQAVVDKAADPVRAA
jgi:hypothetical protein